MNSSFEKLSSGSRINRAGDDAAGLSISEKARAKFRSEKAALRNLQDGISLVQTAEGAFNEVSNIVVRLRELAIQAASDTIGDTERGFANKEFEQLVAEIDRISRVTEFNGQPLLSTQPLYLEVQAGTMSDPNSDRLYIDVYAQCVTPDRLGIKGCKILTKDDARNCLDPIDGAISRLGRKRSELGALQERFQSAIRNSEVSIENTMSAYSRIRDTDYAVETSELLRSQILTNSGVSLLAQANQESSLALKLLE